MKLFISYRSLDSVKVDTIVARLRSLKDTANQPRYVVWQDKDSIPPGKDWWAAIVDAIIECNVFVFMVSRESVQNVNCRAELRYARERNRPVIPVILEGEYIYNTKTGKNDIDYWEHVPKELTDTRFQFLFYEGTSFVGQLERALANIQADPKRWVDIVAPRPRDPRDEAITNNDSGSLYDEACDYAFRLEFSTARSLFQRLVNDSDKDFGEDALHWITLLHDYERIIGYDKRENTRYKIPVAWADYAKQFPKPFIQTFDPKDFQKRYGNGGVIVEQVITRKAGDRWTDPLGVPMVYVPAGEFLMGSTQQQVNEAFEQGKKENKDAKIEWYSDQMPQHRQSVAAPFWLDLTPVTNSEYARFTEAGGYRNAAYWTEPGWAWAQKENKTGAVAYDGFLEPQQPRVGVTWFEAYAYCHWRGGRLPTEAEWEWAARGPENRIYPWGSAFVAANVIYGRKNGNMTAVVGEGIRKAGASWVGALDMSGNVWDWCSTLYEPYPYAFDDKRESIQNGNRTCVLRGGSWNNNSSYLRAANRNGNSPDIEFNFVGFRCVRSL